MLSTLRRLLSPTLAQQTLHTRRLLSQISTKQDLPSDIPAALALLRSQPAHYIVATFVGRRYLLAPSDVLTVPRLRDVSVGDVLHLDSIHEIGSRDYTLRGTPTLPPHVVSVQATVVEHTKGKMEFITKRKRRKDYKRTVQHKQTYTRLRIGPVVIPVANIAKRGIEGVEMLSEARA